MLFVSWYSDKLLRTFSNPKLLKLVIKRCILVRSERKYPNVMLRVKFDTCSARVSQRRGLGWTCPPHFSIGCSWDWRKSGDFLREGSWGRGRSRLELDLPVCKCGEWGKFAASVPHPKAERWSGALLLDPAGGLRRRPPLWARAPHSPCVFTRHWPGDAAGLRIGWAVPVVVMATSRILIKIESLSSHVITFYYWHYVSDMETISSHKSLRSHYVYIPKWPILCRVGR